MNLRLTVLLTCFLVTGATLGTPRGGLKILNYTVGTAEADYPTFTHFFNSTTDYDNKDITLTLLADTPWVEYDYTIQLSGQPWDVTKLTIRSSSGNVFSIGNNLDGKPNNRDVDIEVSSWSSEDFVNFELTLEEVSLLPSASETRGLFAVQSGGLELYVTLNGCILNGTSVFTHNTSDWPGECELNIQNCYVYNSSFNEGYDKWDAVNVLDSEFTLNLNSTAPYYLRSQASQLQNVRIFDSFAGQPGSPTSCTLFSGDTFIASDCTFIGVDGFAICSNVNDELVVSNCIFEDCTGSLLNGGGSQSPLGLVSLVDSTFNFCIQDYGGGICNFTGDIAVERCSFEDNIGPLIEITGGGTNADIVDCTFSRNWTHSLYLWYDGDCNVTNSSFFENHGAAIYSYVSLPIISYTDFCGNDIDIDGPFIDAGENTWSVDCEPEPLCFADCNFDYNVDVLDILYVIAVWGTDNPAGDITEDGWVDVSDLLAVISAWGSCP